MSAGVPLASWKTQIFESLLGFLPDWVQITVLALVVLAVLTSWVLKLKRRIAARRQQHRFELPRRCGTAVGASGFRELAAPAAYSWTDPTTRGAGPAERARHAGGDGPAPERRQRISARRKQSAVLWLLRGEALELVLRSWG